MAASETLALSALQFTSATRLDDNFKQVESLLEQLQPALHRLVLLPECWACFGGAAHSQYAIAEEKGQGEIQFFLSQQAKKHRIWLVGGTIPIKQAASDKFYAATLVFDPQGNCIAQYNKIHLFDVEVNDGTGRYFESEQTEAGKEVVCFTTPFGKVGLAICYDLRFPELFRILQAQNVDIICLPSAFTQLTGEAHWQPLIQARAIENQCYMLAANQIGEHENGRQTWGHSMIVDAWGNMLINAKRQTQIIQQLIDFNEMRAIRQKMPNLMHRKIKVANQL